MKVRKIDNSTSPKNAQSRKTRVLAICDYVCCAFLALALSAAPNYVTQGDCEFSLTFFLTACVQFAVLIAVTFVIRKLLASKVWQSDKVSRNKAFIFLERVLNCKHPVVSVAVVILVFWAIPLIFLYPGTCTNDTWGQLHQYMTYFADGATNAAGEVSDHHPIFDTFLIGTLIVPLAQATGLWKLFMFLYVLMQAICTSLAFSCAVNYSHKKLKIGILPTLGMLFVFCCCQIFPQAVQIISKDSLHAWIFVFYALFFTELVRTNGKVIREKKFLALFCLTIVFCCLTKKVGLYVILLSLLCFLIFCKNNRKFVLIPMLCALFLMQVAMPLVLNEAGVTSGSKREMLSLPFQMTARYVKEHDQDVTDQEREVIDENLQYDTLAERYDPDFADPVKYSCEVSEDADLFEYLIVWVKQGIRHPGSYLRATNSLVAGWFSWDEYVPLMNNDWRTQFEPTEIPEDVPERGMNKGVADAYQEMVRNLYTFPMLRVFHTFAFWATLVISFAICTVIRCRKNKKRCWMALLPSIFALLLGCWLAPVSSYGFEGVRYLFPVVETAPLLLAWCLHAMKSDASHNLM